MADAVIAPDKLNVVSSNYQDPEDIAYSQWAVSSSSAASDGNLVIPFIYGEDLFTQMGRDFYTAKTKDHFIYLIGFETSLDTPMGATTLESHLTSAAGMGVLVRGIFYGDGNRRAAGQFSEALKRGVKDNSPLVNHINKIGGKAYLDDHCSVLGAHHQKIVVIYGDAGLIAYCGGVDLCKNRADRARWHDVHCRLQGPAAFELYKLFRERWDDNENAFGGFIPTSMIAPPPQSPVGGNLATYSAQVGRTYPVVAGSVYPFARFGERTIFEMIINAIRCSTKFIYVEDQFLVCRDSLFVKELKTRLAAPSFKCLIMLTCHPNEVGGVLGNQANYRRKLLIDELRAVAPDKVITCTRKNQYVHAKTWIFDDKFAIIGSANMNNRGYFSDSEAAVGIADKNPGGTRLWFAHRLRMGLWMKHLGISEKDALDPMTMLDKWRTGAAEIIPLPLDDSKDEKSDAKWLVYDPPA